MHINLTGLIAASSAFLGIWLGHVTVRKVERLAPKLWPPIIAALALGVGLETISLSTAQPLLSASTGILGITFLWDALEFTRQEKRIKKGHAPANPANPRHARILAEHPDATTTDLLDRDPIGCPVTVDEAIRLVDRKDTKGAQ
ncbi:MAG: DUF4491 family protein [Chloroflexi bacterium]|nr:DUF4491 family protein [Chloroflexota bacterium]